MIVKTEYSNYLHRTIDTIGECEEKRDFENQLDRINNALQIIANNVTFLTTVYEFAEAESEKGRTVTLNSLKTMLMYNSWGMTILQTCTLLEKKGKDDSISLSTLISFAERNQDRIFTKTRQEAKVRENIDVTDDCIKWLDLPSPNVQEVIDHCDTLMEQIKEDKEKLVKIRNKIYAHNTRGYSEQFLRRTLLQEISTEDIKKIQDVAIKIVNELSDMYKQERYQYFTATIPKETLEIFGKQLGSKQK